MRPVARQHQVVPSRRWTYRPGTTTDIRALREFQERQAVLVAELRRRTRNLIIVHSLSDSTIGNAASLDDLKGVSAAA